MKINKVSNILTVTLTLVSCTIFSSMAFSRVVCGNTQKIIAVSQGYPGMDERDLSMWTRRISDGSVFRYTTSGDKNLGINPETQALQKMALTAMTMNATVFVFAKDDCSTKTYHGFEYVDKWVGLEIKAEE